MADMFGQMDVESKKTIANVIFDTLKKPILSYKIMRLRYPRFNDATLNDLLLLMQQLSIITDMHNGEYQVNPRKPADLAPPVLWLLMTDGKFKKEEIEEVLAKLPPIEKKEVSSILSENSEFDWINIEDQPAPENKPVAIRFYDPSKNYGESADMIFIAEDMKIATLEDGIWSILPPYPLYDYSPLSNKSSINENCIVTHWAEVSDEEMEGWNTRFNPLSTYKHLNIEVDKDHEELLYKTLLWSSRFIRQAMEANKDNGTSGDLMKYYEILCDLQYCMDTGKPLENMKE